jgi:hypothetical protein
MREVGSGHACWHDLRAGVSLWPRLPTGPARARRDRITELRAVRGSLLPGLATASWRGPCPGNTPKAGANLVPAQIERDFRSQRFRPATLRNRRLAEAALARSAARRYALIERWNPESRQERWLSGLKRRFAKPLYGLKPVPGVRIPPSPLAACGERGRHFALSWLAGPLDGGERERLGASPILQRVVGPRSRRWDGVFRM